MIVCTNNDFKTILSSSYKLCMIVVNTQNNGLLVIINCDILIKECGSFKKNIIYYFGVSPFLY